MAETFPGTLQQKLNEASFSYNMGETKISSQMDIGPAKLRRRFTNGIDTFSCTINLKFSDWQTLKDFHDTTLDGGTKTFNYTHPFTQVSAVFRFINAPKIAPLGGQWFRVTMKWEQINE